MSPSDDETIRSMLRFGLSRAIQVHSEEVRARFPRLALELDLIDDEQLLSQPTCHALFRVYLEAMNNIERHMDEITGPSGDPPVWIRDYVNESAFVLEIRDDGSSFSIPGDWAKFISSRGGVMGMKAHIEELGGALHVSTDPVPGVLIQASIPLSEKNP